MSLIDGLPLVVVQNSGGDRVVAVSDGSTFQRLTPLVDWSYVSAAGQGGAVYAVGYVSGGARLALSNALF